VKRRNQKQPGQSTWTRRTALHCERPGVGWIQGINARWIFHPADGSASSEHGSLADAQEFADRRERKSP
jgi:hypothetical protein